MAAGCAVCGEPVQAKSHRGRPGLYCSRSCQAKAYRARRATAADSGGRAAAVAEISLPGPAGAQALADILWRDVVTLVSAAKPGSLVSSETVAATVSAARRGLSDLIDMAQASTEHGRDEISESVTKTGLGAELGDPAPGTPAADHEGHGREHAVRPDEQDEAPASRRFYAVGRLGPDWATDDDDALWWQRETKVGWVTKTWPGSGWEAFRSNGFKLPNRAGTRGRYPSKIKALAAIAAEYERKRRATTPHADLQADGLPAGWRLTQTLADHDDHVWSLIGPDGRTAGRINRVTYGKRPEWQAHAGDDTSSGFQPSITPSAGDPGRGSDDDLWRTRAAAAQAIAHLARPGAGPRALT